MCSKPLPEQAGQRPVPELKENVPASYLRFLASGDAAKRRRMVSNAPMKSAGVLRVVLPIGD